MLTIAPCNMYIPSIVFISLSIVQITFFVHECFWCTLFSPYFIVLVACFYAALCVINNNNNNIAVVHFFISICDVFPDATNDSYWFTLDSNPDLLSASWLPQPQSLRCSMAIKMHNLSPCIASKCKFLLYFYFAKKTDKPLPLLIGV